MSAGAAHLHFAMPRALETFPRFRDLPYDIRHKIWELIIYTPGIHFLKFERNDIGSFHSDGDDSSSDEDDDDSDDDEGPQPQNPRRPETSKAVIKAPVKYSGTLKPIFPLPAADLSYYITATKTLTQLSFTCNEGADEVRRVMRKTDNLTLSNGRLITLTNSSDVICIDYPDLLCYRGLSKWAEKLDQSQLLKIRRLAIRYQPEWDEDRRACRFCGRYHDTSISGRKEPVRRHLYEFVALFRNLDAFFFIDHLIVRKPFLEASEHEDPRWLAPGDRRRVVESLPGLQGGGVGKGTRGERFESGGRTYFEIDREQLGTRCKVHSHVFAMLEWVRDGYVALCDKKPERHGGDPRAVKFAVLACEWEEEKLVQEKKPVSVKKSKRPIQRAKRPAVDESDVVDAMAALKLGDQSKALELMTSMPVVFGDGGKSAFEFTFDVKA